MKYIWHLITKLCCWGKEITALTKLGDLTVLLYVSTGTKLRTSVATDANYAYSGETNFKEKL
jgi:hypothetical protein